MVRNLDIAASLGLVLGLASCATAPPPGGGLETAGLDRAADPCTDFYEFANGSWLAANPIPDSMQRWSRRAAARQANQRKVQAILEELSAKTDWPAGSVEQLVGDHYASCMDETKIDAAGLTPLAPLLAEIDAARNLADVQRIIRRLHDLAVSVPFGTSGGLDYHQPTRFIVNVVAGGLGLPERDDYLKPEPRFVEVRAKYLVHITNLLELKGMPDASQAAALVLALEQRLAEASLDSVADPAATDHKLTFAELEKLAPSFDWGKYFDEAKLPRIDLNINEPKFIQQLEKELKETPISTWKIYLTSQLLDSASPWLSRPFVEESFHFRDKFLGGATKMKPRAERCAESTEALFGEALGKKYVERYFPPAAKAKVQEMIGDLMAVLKQDVAGVQWMAPETKKKTLEKLATYTAQVGYPDRWKDYSTVSIRRDSFWANVAQGRNFNVGDDRRHVGKPSDPGLWQLPPSSSGAYLDLQLNEIVLPAGFLQAPAFRLDATDAVNFGTLGAGVAHDMTHAIDAGGAQLDAQGRPQNWWTEADVQEFQKRGQCVIDQFEGYFIEPGVHHQGKLVLSESIGDLAGVRLAYLALEKSRERRPIPVAGGFTPEQQFFISYGQARGEAVRLETQRQIVKSDPHPISKFRVIGPLSNSPEFQRAFSCKAGAKMVRPKRCAVW